MVAGIAATTDPSRLQMSGFLHKRGNLVKTWHRRWFVARGGELFLFYFQSSMQGQSRSSTSGSMLGQMSLEGATVEDRESSVGQGPSKLGIGAGKYAHRFAVVTKERELLLSAESPREKEDWMRFLVLIVSASKDKAKVKKRRTLLQVSLDYSSCRLALWPRCCSQRRAMAHRSLSSPRV